MADTAHLSDTRLVALDWGTSALRAFRLDDQGQVLEQRHRPWGIMNLPPAPAGHTDTEPGSAFERALQDACGDWLAALPSVPVLACGMVGSAQGWREAKYLDAPTSLDALAQDHVHTLPRPIVRVLEGLGALRGTGAALASYLLFEPGFIAALMALGQADVHARADDILAFLRPATNHPVR